MWRTCIHLIITYKPHVRSYITVSLSALCLCNFTLLGKMFTFLLSWIVIGAWLIPQCTFGQIPAACADEESLENLRCCPATADGVCGEDAGRGNVLN